MVKIIFLVVVFILIVLVTSLNPEKVLIAVNCGGDQYEDANGVIYEKDNYFNDKNSVASDFGLQYDIELTKDEELYQTERWANGDLVYTLPVSTIKPGKYIIILKFSEVYFSAADDKVFDIALGKKIVVKDMDVFEKVGKAKAHDEYIQIEFKDDGYIYYKVSALIIFPK